MKRPGSGPRGGQIVSRFAAGVFGGWGFSWGFVSLAIAGSVALGADFHEAETAALLLAFVVYLVLLLWAFAAVSAQRVWAVLAGGAVAMTGAAWALQHLLL